MFSTNGSLIDDDDGPFIELFRVVLTNTTLISHNKNYRKMKTNCGICVNIRCFQFKEDCDNNNGLFEFNFGKSTL